MKNIMQYRNERSHLTELHPTLKLLLLIFTSITLFLLTNPFTFFIVFLFIFLISLTAHYNPLKTIRQLKFLLFFFLILPFFHSALFPGAPIFRIFSINFSLEGFIFGLAVVMRLLILFTAFTLFSITTNPKKLTQSMTQNRFNIIKKAGFLISFVFNLIPTIFRDIDKIKDAQTSRGADFNQRNLSFLRKIRNSRRLFQDYLSLIIPLLVVSLSRAEKQAIAIECRGFNLTNRTFLHELKIRGKDMTVFMIYLLLILFTLVLDKNLFKILQ